jgi:hypothetical protein
MSFLRNLKKLHTLNITGCRKISDTGISLLCESEINLKYINFAGSGVSDSGYALLAGRFPGIKTNLSMNYVAF